MADDSVAVRLSNLNTKWNWISQAPPRVDALNSALSALKSRLSAIDSDDVNGKIVVVTQGNERGLPQLSDQLQRAQQVFSDEASSFDNTMEDLNKRADAVASQVG